MIGVLVEIAVAVLASVVVLIAVGLVLAWHFDEREKRREPRRKER